MGRPRLDDRTGLNGIVWKFRAGEAWRDVPERYGPWASLHARFRRWAADGTFDRMLQTPLGTDADTRPGRQGHLRSRPSCRRRYESSLATDVGGACFYGVSFVFVCERWPGCAKKRAEQLLPGLITRLAEWGEWCDRWWAGACKGLWLIAERVGVADSECQGHVCRICVPCAGDSYGYVRTW